MWCSHWLLVYRISGLIRNLARRKRFFGWPFVCLLTSRGLFANLNSFLIADANQCQRGADKVWRRDLINWTAFARAEKNWHSLCIAVLQIENQECRVPYFECRVPKCLVAVQAFIISSCEWGSSEKWNTLSPRQKASEDKDALACVQSSPILMKEGNENCMRAG